MNTKTYLAFLTGLAAGACCVAAIVSIVKPKKACIKCECQSDEPAERNSVHEYTDATSGFINRVKNRHVLKNAFAKVGDEPCEDSYDALRDAVYDEKYNKSLNVDEFDLSGAIEEEYL